MSTLLVEAPIFPTTIDVPIERLNIVPTIDTRLSDGGQGVVYKGYWKTTKVAVKVMALNYKTKPSIEKEIKALSQVEHPNICALVGWYIPFAPKSLPVAALVTEFYSGGELFDKVMKEKMSEDAIMNMFKQLFDAVFHIHSKDIIHCDIKLENIVLTLDDTPKLIDFGFTNTPNVGSLNYVAPEATHMLHKGLDIWGLGICLWACLTQSFPFNVAHETCLGYNMVLAVMKSKHVSMCDAIHTLKRKECTFSLDIKHLLDSMLCVDYRKRCTIRDIHSTKLCCVGDDASCASQSTLCREKRKRSVY